MNKRIKIDGDTYDSLKEIADDNDLDNVGDLASFVLDAAIEKSGLVSAVIDENYDDSEEPEDA